MKALFFDGAKARIVQSGEQALLFQSHCAQMDVDFHLSTGIMDIDMQLLAGQQEAFVSLLPFLRFFHRYQVRNKSG